jgi:prolyl-tRNA synthetase
MIVIVGRDAAEGRVELWDRRSGARAIVALDEVEPALR